MRLLSRVVLVIVLALLAPPLTGVACGQMTRGGYAGDPAAGGPVPLVAIDADRPDTPIPYAPSAATARNGPHDPSRVVAVLPMGRKLPDDGLVSVGLPAGHVLSAVQSAARCGTMLIAGAFAVALAAFVAWMIRGVVRQPVRALQATAARWQAGDTTARLPAPKRCPAMADIAAPINALLDAMAAGETGLRERLAELRAIYDGAPVGLGYVGRDLRYVSVNARLAEINDVPAERHVGRTVREILPSVAYRVEPLLARALQGEAIPPTELQAAAPGAPQRLLVSFQPAVAPGGAVLGVVTAVQPITTLRETESALRAALEQANADLEARVAERTRQFEAEVREREAAQAQLLQAQKTEVIGQLTGGVAHDFNNLLTAIIGNLELAMARSQDRPDVVRLLAGAMRSADRGAALTQRMLAFGRRQFLRFQPVALPALLEGMAELLARTLGPAIRVRFEVPTDLCPVRADPNQVELVVLNLAVNARDAMPTGGEIVIAAGAEHVPMAALHRAGLAPGDYAWLSVSDTGEGMDEATRARAFEPFFTTKAVGRGSGLGLSMVQGVAAQSDGGVAIASVPGEGTSVTFWLPCAEAAVPDAAAAPRSVPMAGTRRSVLLVDDDPDVVAFAAICLEEAGYDVRHAGGGAEALDMLATGPAPDLLIADLGMPGMDGAQLASAARRLHPHLTILIATGYAPQEADARGSLNLPVLNKPFKAADLLGRVADLLQRDASDDR